MSNYKIALAPIEYEIGMRKVRGYEATPLSDAELETIRHALLLADKVTGEPSASLLQAAQDAWLNDPTKRSSTLFKAMIQQAEREIEV